MTKKRHILTGATSLLLAAAILIGVLGTLQQAIGGPTGAFPTAGDDINLHSTVTIKTQKAADSIKGGIRGVDVSKWNGKINWKKVAKDDVEFAFIRATYGTTKDPQFLTNARNAHKNGLKVGAYHYATFRNTSQMKEEAAYFISRLKKVDITYPVVLDLEDTRHTKIKKSTLSKLAIQFMDLVEAEGYTVMLYSSYNFLLNYVDTKKVAKNNNHLWIANYVERPKSLDHKIWQHTAAGKVSGINGNVDINIAYEDLSTKKKSTTTQRTPPERDDSSVRTPPDDGSSVSSSSSSSSGSGSGSKTSVDKSISNAIKATLNQHYPVNVPANSNSSQELHQAIAYGLQYEMNVKFDENLPIDGQLRRDQVALIYDHGFSKTKTSKVTYLVQARLFYLGHYTSEPSSVFDDETASAVRSYQKVKGLGETGKLDAETLRKLLM